MSVSEANTEGRAQALRELSIKLAEAIDNCDDDKSLPHLSRQYRETLRELSDISVEVDNDIADIVSDIKPVRKR